MIGTIRKHSKWLWWFIIAAIIVTFVFWGVNPSRMGGGGSVGDLGKIYGRAVTQQEYVEARNIFYIFYWLHYGEWPNRAQNFTDKDLQRETYIRLLLDRKAAALGVHIGDDVVVEAAKDMLRSAGRNGKPVEVDTFIKQVLTPEGLTAADFERFVREDITIQQLVQSLGLSGGLITPQEAATFYQREHQELSAQAVFFSASNYLSQVAVTPAAVAQFYTNYLAAYRLPDRVSVSCVAFEVSNFLAQSKAEWARTNFDEYVEATFSQYGMSQFPEAKTPEEAKAKIREILIHNRATADARQQANDFANTLFPIEPVKAENLATVARQKDMTVLTTEPFDATYGPREFSAPAEFIKDAFALNADYPLAGPITGPDAVYIIALVKQVPSEIPPLDQIRGRVALDFQEREAALLAQRAGTNFVAALNVRMAAGKTFATASVAAGYSPEALPPFSLSTPELPALGDRVELNLLKRAAFTTPAGRISGFVETDAGGFVVFVQSQLPLDQAAMNAEMPQFTTQLRRGRQNEAFNLWLQAESNRELSNIPMLRQQAADSGSAR